MTRIHYDRIVRGHGCIIAKQYYVMTAWRLNDDVILSWHDCTMAELYGQSADGQMERGTQLIYPPGSLKTFTKREKRKYVRTSAACV